MSFEYEIPTIENCHINHFLESLAKKNTKDFSYKSFKTYLTLTKKSNPIYIHIPLRYFKYGIPTIENCI